MATVTGPPDQNHMVPMDKRGISPKEEDILILEKRNESKADRTGVSTSPHSDHVLPLVCMRAGSLAAGRPWETWLVSPAVLAFTSSTQMLPSTVGAQSTLAPNFSGPSSGHQGPWMLTNLTFSSNQPYTNKVI